ncbi:hypothetical protein IAQ61_000277 [Plenodomus lingam]|uniref:uncharacterized protein n=1 Tax=Leptosphaeria maculans TaxID=5022 RepID=UPI0033275259|nr:hypothetical protein IAQ61_000277 [Plenodomus lingam]
MDSLSGGIVVPDVSVYLYGISIPSIPSIPSIIHHPSHPSSIIHPIHHPSSIPSIIHPIHHPSSIPRFHPTIPSLPLSTPIPYPIQPKIPIAVTSLPPRPLTPLAIPHQDLQQGAG